MEVRCRLVARDFKGKDKDRDDLFAATPPLEAKMMLLSRAATRETVGQTGPRKLLFIDAKNAHLNPRCEQYVFIELPEEAGCGPRVWEIELLALWVQTSSSSSSSNSSSNISSSSSSSSSTGEACFRQACGVWI